MKGGHMVKSKKSTKSLLPIPLTAALLRMPIPPAAVLPAMLTPLATAAPPRPAAAAALPTPV